MLWALKSHGLFKVAKHFFPDVLSASGRDLQMSFAQELPTTSPVLARSFFFWKHAMDEIPVASKSQALRPMTFAQRL